MSTKLSVSLPLPAGYRPNDILAFHRRDAQEIAERVNGTHLEKGMVWRGFPACLSVHFQGRQAEVELSIDGHCDGNHEFEFMIRRLLGLTQDIEEFEARFRGHFSLGRLIARQSGLRVPVSSTPFEALTWAVTGQQISVAAAVSLRRRLVMSTNIRHSSGLLCYPGADQIAELNEHILRQSGFSTTKANTLLTLSRMAHDGTLPLDDLPQNCEPVGVIREKLKTVRGIGPWTINYTLLRGFGWLDGSLHGDAAVRRGLQTLLDLPADISEKDAMNWLAQFSPWRALVAAHIWAARSAGLSSSY